MGDLNSKTGDKLDFIASQGTRFITGNNSLFPSHPPRQNWDLQVNAHGRQLLQLCQNLALYIVNGRLRGDSLGRYTYSSALGNSTVDYAITDLHLSSLRAFTVKPLKPFSDHSQITLYIKQSETSPTPIRTPYQIIKIMSFKWTENSTTNYINAVNLQKYSPVTPHSKHRRTLKTNSASSGSTRSKQHIIQDSTKSNLTTVKPRKNV